MTISSARALCRINRPKKAFAVLAAALNSEYQWGRLQAAIVLDEIDEMARPLEDELKKALRKQPNKYIVRVANRALNEINGTNNKVP